MLKKIETLRELQIVQTDMLREFYSFCSENKLRCFLWGGTLIGAVRHQGFIPWDDDVDLCIPRPDYDELLRLSNEGISDNLALLAPEKDKKYRGYIPRIVLKKSKLVSGQYRVDDELQIGISIFVMDGAPDNSFSRWFYYKKMYLLRALHACCIADFRHASSRIGKLAGPVLTPFFNPDQCYKYRDRVLRYAKKYSYADSVWVSPNADTDGIKEVAEKELYEQVIPIQFENMTLFASGNYESHLKSYYGDYMMLPPEDKRLPKHDFSAWVEVDE